MSVSDTNLIIKRKDGTVAITIDNIPEGALVHRELMGEHYVQIPFTLQDIVYLKLGDYVELSTYGRFELTEPYSPKYNRDTGGYDYTLQLDAYYMKWKNKIVRYMPNSAASETSFNLTAAIGVHLGVIVNGINALGSKDSNYRYNGNTFSYQLMNFPAGKVNTAKYKQYQNTDFISALDDLATIFDCEWWVEANVIYFGRCELSGTAIDFELDSNVEEMTSSQSDTDYATRIVAFGSEKNLPKTYRENQSADITQNGVVQKRLMLPLTGEHACPYGYLQDANLANETEAIEIVVVDENIYPRTNCVVSAVTTYTDSYVDQETQETVTKTYYRLTDSSGLNFSSDYILEGETLHILFQSGTMNGMDFECHYDDDGEYYEVVVNEDYGRELPDANLHPAVGDTFVLYGWDSSRIENTGLVAAAEEELYQAVVTKLEELKKDPNTYNCVIMSDWYENEMSANNLSVYSLGQPVRLLNPTFFSNGRNSRIIGYELCLDIPYDTPKFIVGEAAAYSRTKSMEKQIDSLIYNGVTYQNQGNGSSGGVYVITTTSQTPASDYNVYSAARSDRQFLRRDKSDTAHGQITHEQMSILKNGAQFGQSFVSGLVGSGGKIDGAGSGELRSLKLWEWLEVPELRYNKVTIYTGIRWDTFGGGIINTITPDANAETGSGTLKLDDGEIGAISVGDLCMGIWHDSSGNSSANSDDNVGNFTFAGFKTVYFQITGVSGAYNQNFTYILRSQALGGNSVHPFVGMHFAGRGNISNTDRQAFTYTTTEYSLSLRNVSTWQFQAGNYYEIHGHLEGFSMPAIDKNGNSYTKVFQGYGQVFGNAYIFGQIDQFERISYRCFIEQSLGGTLAPGETENVSVSVLNGYGEDVTSQFTHIAVTRNTGDAASDAVWNARHTEVTNPFQIAFSDLGIDGINKVVAVFNIVASDEDNETASASAEYLS